MGLATALLSLAGGLAAFVGRASAQDYGNQACNFEVGAPVKTTSGECFSICLALHLIVRSIREKLLSYPYSSSWADIVPG